MIAPNIKDYHDLLTAVVSYSPYEQANAWDYAYRVYDDVIVIRQPAVGVDKDTIEIKYAEGELKVVVGPIASEGLKWKGPSIPYTNGTFTYRIKPDIDAGKITARLKNGLLDIQLPLTASSKGVKVKVVEE